MTGLVRGTKRAVINMSPNFREGAMSVEVTELAEGGGSSR
jgi:hypothetical protein